MPKDLTYLDNLEPSIVISLRKKLSSVDKKEEYSSITINEPCFSQVDQFYKEQEKNGNMAAISLLISLCSAPLVPQNILATMNYRD